MTGDDLLATVLAAPDDDAPRLVYADWLEEQGNERPAKHAELIRTQLILARRYADSESGCYKESPRPSPRCKCPYCVALRNESKLVAWANDYLVVAPLSGRVKFRRGFVDKVCQCPGSVWLDCCDELLRRHPVREVTIDSWRHPEDTSRLVYGRPAEPLRSGQLPDGFKRRWPGVAFAVVVSHPIQVARPFSDAECVLGGFSVGPEGVHPAQGAGRAAAPGPRPGPGRPRPDRGRGQGEVRGGDPGGAEGPGPQGSQAGGTGRGGV